MAFENKQGRRTPRLKAARVIGIFALATACREAPRPPSAPAPSGAPRPAAQVAAEPWWRDAVGYEIFVRSFRDSNGDGIGDLRGVIERLDYLNDGNDATEDDLGINLLWLMPINEGPSYHGYAVSDYRAVESDYGSLADFDALIAAARARGIRVVLDLVVNHSSDEHPWFREAAASRDGPRRNFYVWRDQDLGWKPPWGGGVTWHRRGDAFYYGLFSESMPDLNLEEPKVRDEMFDVARFWLARGAAGFRLDAARYLVETGGGPKGQADTEATHAFWRGLRAAAKAERSDALLIGEVWESTPIVVSYFGRQGSPELDMSFDFDTAGSIIHAIRRGDGEPARLALAARLAAYPAFASAGTFLANHDQYRVATVLDHRGTPAAKLAAAVLLTAPGTPWLYYGEEIGQTQGAEGGDDRLKRRPFQWTGGPGVGFTSAKEPWMPPASLEEAASVRGQTRDPESLLSTYRRLVHFRRRSAALRRGSTRIVAASGSASEPLVLVREHGDQTLLLVFNFSSEASEVEVPNEAAPPARKYREVFGRAPLAREGDGPLRVRGLEAYGYRIFEAEPITAR